MVYHIQRECTQQDQLVKDHKLNTSVTTNWVKMLSAPQETQVAYGKLNIQRKQNVRTFFFFKGVLA